MAAKAKVLAVDDEKALCNILALNLEDAGFEVTQAYSGNEALRLLATTRFDIVISDIRMPDGDGVLLLTRVKSGDPTLPVVLFITAFADIGPADAYNLGAEALFRKPVRYDELIAKVQECLDRARRQRQRRHERVTMPFKVDISPDGFQSFCEAQGLNIGRGGFFLQVDADWPRVDTPLDFRLRFADPTIPPITGKGVCRWRRHEAQPEKPKGLGIEIHQLQDETDARSMDLILDATKIAYIPIA